MFKQKLLPSVLTTMILTGVLIADAFYIGSISKDGQELQEAGILKLVLGHKWYDQQGNFKGCVRPGDECVIFYYAFGEVTLSSEGIHLQ